MDQSVRSVASIGFTLSPSQPATYIVSGYYVNNTQGYNCQGTAYPITGIYYANTQTLSFSVAWSNSSEDCQSVTGWTGYVDYGATPLQMVTNWNLAYESTGGSQIMQGQDTFTRNQTRTQNDLIAD
ncbi:avidin/streptavidin family protein [Loktanella agnita]|uniref:avidin/streptavidin family protein n=1 Tax=Loktanella agnita TaxID=287097 RepID=UPI00398A226C